MQNAVKLLGLAPNPQNNNILNIGSESTTTLLAQQSIDPSPTLFPEKSKNSTFFLKGKNLKFEVSLANAISLTDSQDKPSLFFFSIRRIIA